MEMDFEKFEALGSGVAVWLSKRHTFGTDAILLAHFAAPKKGERVCDLGTGCGIIPLLWSREALPSHIWAVELQETACCQFHQSIRDNTLDSYMTLFQEDLRNSRIILQSLQGKKLDLVTMNPPYQALGTGRRSAFEHDDIARHETACTLPDVAQAAKTLLRFGGRLCLCHRPDRLCDTLVALREAGLEPKVLQLVTQRDDKAPWLFLVEAHLGGKPGLRILPQLVMRQFDGKPTPAIGRIYGEYGAKNP